MIYPTVAALTENAPIGVESEWAELKECVYGSPQNYARKESLASFGSKMADGI